ncbi:DUF397 domain-containing protein [Streptomyces sp. NPDC008092]|uniref:DUF397 domain-containing protein n=1 Tax=Streptomyces sp. NPDC008092 TaxID=3364808 RepID=UPI0036EEA2FF
MRTTTAEDASGLTCLTWFKSSYSRYSSSHSSSYSSGSEGDFCVEAATTPATVHGRDSKNTATPFRGPHLTFPPATWTTFLSHAAATGE